MTASPISIQSTTRLDVNATSATASGMPAMNGNEFMLILLAQLKNQNPLEPMDNNEFMGQMTQLNSLQELQRINSTLEYLVAVVEVNGGGTE